MTALAPASAPTGADARSRGTLTLSDGVVEKIASQVVAEVNDTYGTSRGLLGLVLLLAAVLPGRRTGVPVDLTVTDADQSEVVITQRGVAGLAAAAADEVDGVESVDVSVSARLVRVEVVTASRSDVESVRSAVQSSVEDRLDVLGSGPVCEVRTRVRSRES